MVRLSKLKIGDAFQFEEGGTVWVKVRGGFRHGLGGPLHAYNPNILVIKYNP